MRKIYGYSFNDPVNFVDPRGLASVCLLPRDFNTPAEAEAYAMRLIYLEGQNNPQDLTNIFDIMSYAAAIFASGPIGIAAILGQLSTGDYDGAASDTTGVAVSETIQHVGGKSVPASIIGAGIGAVVESTANK